MKKEIEEYNQLSEEVELCNKLATLIDKHLMNAENKIWHSHPVWFLEGNPIVGYSKQKNGKFKDASVFYNSAEEIKTADIIRWLEKSKEIQWDYKNLIKRKGKLERLK
jgi:hypothetical protein